jgi:hypothetical protein
MGVAPQATGVSRAKPILCASGIAADAALLPRIIVDSLAYAPIL